MVSGLNSIAVTTGTIAVLLVTAWRLGGRLLRRYFVRKFTVVEDLQYVSESRPPRDKIRGTAIVCGGSVSGLLAARLLANHFEAVLIVEAEGWLDTELGTLPVYNKDGNIIDASRLHSRARVWQYDAVHTFLPIVAKTVTKLFPGIKSRILDGDGRIISSGINMQCRDGRVFRKTPDFLFMSREFFERLLRSEVLKCDGVKHISGTATNVSFKDGDPSKITGVSVRSDNGSETYFPAVFVADCTGPAQVGYKWLKRIERDFSPPPQIQNFLPINDLREEYSIASRSRRFRFYVPPTARLRLPIPGGYDNVGWVYSYLPVPGVDGRSCIINRIEGHRIEVLLSCRQGVEMPETFEDIIPFMENMSTLHKVPDWVIRMFEVLIEYREQCEELPSTTAIPFSRVLFEKAPFIPSNFVPIGDSCMRVNPVYGQGTSKSCMSVVMLNGLLRSERNIEGVSDGFGRNFVEVQAQKTFEIWRGNITIDYQWPSTTPVAGHHNSEIDGAAKFTDLIMRCAIKNDAVDEVMTGIRGFLAPPTDMLRPKLLSKLVGLWIQTKLGLA